MAKPHGCRLEDVSNLRIDGRVVPTAAKVEGVSFCGLIREPAMVALILPIKQYWEPLIIHNVLVGGNGELTGSIEQPLIVLPLVCVKIQSAIVSVVIIVVDQSPGPPVVDTEPQDTHGEQERILVTTWITNSYCKIMDHNNMGRAVVTACRTEEIMLFDAPKSR